MTPAHLKLTVPLTLLFLALALIARAVGSSQPPNPALEGFTLGCQDKPQPCWYGIVPGVTTVEEAERILAAHQFMKRAVIEAFQLTYDLPQDSGLMYLDLKYSTSLVIHHILFRPAPNLQIGEVIRATRNPQWLMFAGIFGDLSLGYNTGDGGVWMNLGRVNRSIDPFTANVAYIAVRNPMSRLSVKFLPWAGFMLRWRYCQREAESPFCG